MLCVALLADGAGWESGALALLEASPDITVLKRCVDVDDLMASVTTGQLDVAVLAAEVPGLDAAAVTHLGRHGCAAVAVVAGGHPDLVPQRLTRAGVGHVLDVAALTELPALVREVGARVPGAGARATPGAHDGAGTSADDSVTVAGIGAERGSVVVVWGPVGSPGRTTVATALAGLLAARGRPTIIVDADRHASVAQHLGVLDQVSGLLSAARSYVAGNLAGRVQGACRALTPRLGVLTGLPRPDRRDEVPEGALGEIVEEVTRFADVVVDLGHDLDADQAPGTPGAWAVEMLERADEVVVVGCADPVGLARLAHALVELADVCEEVVPRVVLNRTRSTLGWSEKEMADVVARFAPVSAMHFLPEDRAAVDRALVAGEAVTDRSSALTVAVESLLDAVRPDTVNAPSSRSGGRWGRAQRGVGKAPAARVPGPRSPAVRDALTQRTAGTGHPR